MIKTNKVSKTKVKSKDLNSSPPNLLNSSLKIENYPTIKSPKYSSIISPLNKKINATSKEESMMLLMSS